jgi:hypothetical protein
LLTSAYRKSQGFLNRSVGALSTVKGTETLKMETTDAETSEIYKAIPLQTLRDPGG